MKRFLTVLVSFTLLCGASLAGDSRDGGFISIIDKGIKLYNQAIQKVQSAKSVAAIDAIDERLDEQLEMMDDEIEKLQYTNSAEYREARRQANECSGVYYEKMKDFRLKEEEYRQVRKKCRYMLKRIEENVW